VPGIFTQLADQAGVEFDVSMSARNAATLRGHFLNTANADWDLRGNIARRTWDIVVLQEQSDAALPAGRGANANIPQFSAYADKIEKYIHAGTGESYRERAMYTAIYGSVANCVAAGGTTASCDNNTLRTIPANPYANPLAKVYLMQSGRRTWCSPFRDGRRRQLPHRARRRPIVDTTNPVFPNGYPDTLYHATEGLAAATADLSATPRAHRKCGLRSA
jgi:hypothetical protein